MEKYLKWAVAIMAVGIAAGAIGYPDRSAPRAAGSAPAQDIMSVDRRVSTLEQRIYTIESSISQLQQQLMMISRSQAQPGTAGADTQQLRLEVDLLRARMLQIECAIAKLDERTLPPGKTKNRTGIKDPCRQDPQTPIEFQGRPY